MAEGCVGSRNAAATISVNVEPYDLKVDLASTTEWISSSTTEWISSSSTTEWISSSNSRSQSLHGDHAKRCAKKIVEPASHRSRIFNLASTPRIYSLQVYDGRPECKFNTTEQDETTGSRRVRSELVFAMNSR
eukprot:CAMPEP_0114565064 /NCGR_PEP_ID=MMETSP0114-20121206/14093_1 /TAXON_ID=31324 /ORGANISM="Goniomonas sp, Strain m" /LENGTH=132 /DNA_ID=CAMNT_0001751251 /DNA_START=602 /DNA_END=998 /DNA_ORIENTATION=-